MWVLYLLVWGDMLTYTINDNSNDKYPIIKCGCVISSRYLCPACRNAVCPEVSCSGCITGRNCSRNKWVQCFLLLSQPLLFIIHVLQGTKLRNSIISKIFEWNTYIEPFFSVKNCMNSVCNVYTDLTLCLFHRPLGYKHIKRYSNIYLLLPCFKWVIKKVCDLKTLLNVTADCSP